MTLRAKKRALAAFLVLFALWPLGHRWLVATYDVSPWKLFGWAMYCRPNLPVQMRIVELRGSEEAQLDMSRLPPEVGPALADFREERPVLGLLRPPDDVGEALLEALPHAQRIAIVVTRLELSPESGRLRVAMFRYVYGR